MLKVDLIVPTFFKSKKLRNNQIFLYKWKPDWLKVRYNLKYFKDQGVKIRFLNYLNINYKNLSDIVAVDYRIVRDLALYNSRTKSPNNLIISFIRKLRKHIDYIILFDNKASADIQYEVLPFVDRYIKTKLYKDRSLYLKNFYGYRIYTDYYLKNYHLDKNNIYEDDYYADYVRSENIDNEIEIEKKKKIFKKFQNKLALSWNLALADYRSRSILKNPYTLYFLKNHEPKFQKPNLSRRILLAGNFKLDFGAEVFSFQRKELFKFLVSKYNSNPNVSLGRIPKKIYLKTMNSSKAIVSPFGWGEVCYRDFETFIFGAALIKPDMEHLETWPNLYKKNETYIPISWKIEDWPNEFDEILSDEDHLLKIAIKGQEEYKKIWTNQGNEEFCNRFIKLITPN